ncbi:MAG TPA: hypothetical protein VI031_05405 [Pyrinomonadaceae bacterium]
MKANRVEIPVEACTPAPHFDDERTVLSAQPVVPLGKIKARRLWLLGGAFVLAMMLGAGSALLASYLRMRTVPEPAAQITQEEITPAPLAVAESVPSESPASESAGSESPTVESVEEPPATPVVTKPAVKHKAIARRPSDFDLPRNEPKVNEGDDLNRIREAVLYDEWQERRARRVARRERRKADRYNHRDLSNLDEIFEGRKKP